MPKKALTNTLFFASVLLGLFSGIGFLIENPEAVIRLLVPRDATPAIGRVESAHGDVRKRSSKSLIWFAVVSGDLVFNDDVFYTGPKAKTRLVLSKDTEIDIHQNSAAQVDRRGVLNAVTLNNGSISVRSLSHEVLGIKGQGKTLSLKLTEIPKNLTSQLLDGPDPARALRDLTEPDRAWQEARIEDELEEKRRLHWDNPLMIGLASLYLFTVIMFAVDQLRQKHASR